MENSWPGVQDVKVGSMSPLPSFGPDWFTSKLPGTLPPRPLPACAFGLPPAPPGLIAQMPELATVSPGVAAMVAEALRAPPLTTPGMPPPPQSVLAMPVRCGRTSMVPRCGGYFGHSGVEPNCTAWWCAWCMSCMWAETKNKYVQIVNPHQSTKRLGNWKVNGLLSRMVVCGVEGNLGLLNAPMTGPWISRAAPAARNLARVDCTLDIPWRGMWFWWQCQCLNIWKTKPTCQGSCWSCLQVAAGVRQTPVADRFRQIPQDLTIRGGYGWFNHV